MKTWKAGSGVTKINTHQLVMLVVPAPNSQAATATAVWTLPEGIWWKVRQVRTNLDATNATAAVDVNVIATKTGFPGYKVGLATTLAALTFDGIITFGVSLVAYQSVPVGTVNAALPDVWLPPGTIVTLTATTGAGFNVLQQCIITCEGGELVADE